MRRALVLLSAAVFLYFSYVGLLWIKSPQFDLGVPYFLTTGDSARAAMQTILLKRFQSRNRKGIVEFLEIKGFDCFEFPKAPDTRCIRTEFYGLLADCHWVITIQFGTEEKFESLMVDRLCDLASAARWKWNRKHGPNAGNN